MVKAAVMEKPSIIYSKRYIPNGKVSKELEEKVNIALNTLSAISSEVIRTLRDDTENYLIEGVYVVGSVVRGVDDSDVDLYIKTKNTDRRGIGDYKTISDFIKVASFESLCKNKSKTEWVDLYIGTTCPSKEHFEQKYNYNITNQVLHLIKQYNKSMMETKKEPNHKPKPS